MPQIKPSCWLSLQSSAIPGAALHFLILPRHIFCSLYCNFLSFLQLSCLKEIATSQEGLGNVTYLHGTGKKKGVWAESCASLVTVVPRAAGTAASRCAGELVGAREMCAGPEPPSCSCGFLPPAKPYCQGSAPQHPFGLSWAICFVPCPSSPPPSQGNFFFVCRARLTVLKSVFLV